ncbi:carbohydrate ABC transporter permease [Glycomyces buryatensis]|uniref:Carbohydrate ABC transporter permease n=1 Tax=Glycomyces buryatensis TaxID=2570927 RepID=A0A4S8PXD7_9ACTN|nr:carbohydrate ABC transporter permease [Glycomyces buryatensis]THV32899.1 carbohydrate ABC transporter permease [Glycomyces buryatensis]
MTATKLNLKRPKGKRSTILTVALLAVTAYFLLPLVWLIIASTKSSADLFSTFGFWFSGDFAFFDNLQQTLTYDNGVFLRWMGNTILYAVAAAGGGALLAALAGYGFAKYRFKGNRAMFMGVLGAVMVPTTALAIPTYLLFSEIGLADTPWAIILPSLVNPFGLFLMRVYAEQAVPDSLLEAARIDGASEARIFFQVTLRLLAPGFATVLLFALVHTWNNYFLPLIMLNDPELYPITVGLARWQGQAAAAGGASGDLVSLVVTGSMLSIIPLVIAFLYLQRYWQSGLVAGAVKQ